jgi:hypothetical protein
MNRVKCTPNIANGRANDGVEFGTVGANQLMKTRKPYSFFIEASPCLPPLVPRRNI